MIQQVYAQAVGTQVINPMNGTQLNTLSAILGFAFNVVIGVGIALVIIFLGIAGIKYVTSQGDPKAVEAAQKALTNAVIGLVIVLAAVTIRFIVNNLLGGADVSSNLVNVSV